MKHNSGSRGRQYLFVDRSQCSARLTKCLPQEKSLVQKYVQSGRKRPRNSRRPLTLNDDHDSFRETLQVSTAATPHFESSRIDATNSKGSAVTSKQLPSNANVEDGRFFPDVPLLLVPLTYSTTLSKRDPFNATSVPIDQSVAGLLHYYMYHYHPSLWPNERVLLRQGIYTFPESVLDLMKTAISSELTMYCLLSASICRLQFVDRHPSSFPAGTENHYIGEALRCMSRFILSADFREDKSLKEALVCMIYLSSAESYRNDLTAAKAHLAPTARLLQPLGGLSYLKDDNLKGQLAMADLALASFQLEPCLFDCSYNPGPAATLKLATTERRTSFVSSTATSLLNAPDYLVPPYLKSLCEELVESHSIRSRILTSSMSPNRAIEVTHWISLRNMAIRSRLLALKSTDLRIHALRAAVIMWSLLFNVSGRIKTVTAMASKLRSILDKIPPDSWQGCAGIQYWISLLGLYCASEGTETSAWFLTVCCGLNFALCSLQMSTSDETNMVAILERFQLRFFYDASIQHRQTITIAHKLRTAITEHTYERETSVEKVCSLST